MKTTFKHIEFRKILAEGGAGEWECRNRHGGDLLGEVKWYGAWRAYCFFPERWEEIVFSHDCLDDIASFVRAATAGRTKQRKVVSP